MDKEPIDQNAEFRVRTEMTPEQLRGEMQVLEGKLVRVQKLEVDKDGSFVEKKDDDSYLAKDFKVRVANGKVGNEPTRGIWLTFTKLGNLNQSERMVNVEGLQFVTQSLPNGIKVINLVYPSDSGTGRAARRYQYRE
jgi:hypothetical protein